MRLLPQSPAQWPPAPSGKYRDAVAIVAGWCMLFPALTLMIILRRKIGHALLHPGGLIAGALLLIYVPYYHNGGIYSVPFLILGLVVLVAGFVQRRHAWRAIVRGDAWHTQHLGISRLTFLPLHPYDVRRYIEPLLCFGLGAFIAIYVTEGFGIWLEVSGAALLLLEKYAYDEWKARTLANMDRLYEAGMHGQAAEHFSQQPGATTGGGIELGVVPPDRISGRLWRALGGRRR